MKHVLAAAGLAAIMIAAPTTAAYAGTPHPSPVDALISLITDLSNLLAPTDAGQPSASCELTPNPPGNSANNGGSAFADGGVAGGVYAGEQDQNNNNPKSVSQYDQACVVNQSHH